MTWVSLHSVNRADKCKLTRRLTICIFSFGLNDCRQLNIAFKTFRFRLVDFKINQFIFVKPTGQWTKMAVKHPPPNTHTHNRNISAIQPEINLVGLILPSWMWMINSPNSAQSGPLWSGPMISIKIDRFRLFCFFFFSILDDWMKLFLNFKNKPKPIHKHTHT